MIIEDEETLQMYVEESREHLADIENDILAIEECGDDIDEELVNKVFRAAHSIKGGAGFMGLNNIKELSHKMENVLGMIRDGKLTPNAEITNILLEASDVLREMINDVHNSNEVDISQLVEALNATSEATTAPETSQKPEETGSVPAEEPESEDKFQFDIEIEQVNKAIQRGNFIYIVNCDLISDVQEKGKTLNEFISGIKDCGEILDCYVDISAVGTVENLLPEGSFPLHVLFASIIEPDLITTVFDIDKTKLTTIKDETELSSLLEKPSIEDVEEFEVDLEDKEIEVVEETKAEPAPEKQKVKPERKSTPSKTKVSDTKPIAQETSLRVHVQLLDSLMNLAGELVLSRNQLMQAVGSGDQHQLEVISQRIDMITSDLQEAIMLTRMQPVGNIFNKFPRVVRDLARKLGKDVELQLEGKDVELDKTIIEAISDPLTHLVRNAVDHGIEPPEERIKAGKDPKGTVILRAYHEAGQVNIEIADDGKGLDPEVLAKKAVAKGLITEEQASVMSDKEKVNLIFYPGFSTAEQVTDVSGRGVGMDVVKTNLDKLGGEVELDSTPGKGTTIKIKLPLTLTIIPSLLVSTSGDKYAIPQINIEELLRIPSSQVKDRIEKVGNAEVVRLRGQLLPLVRLADALDIDRIYFDKRDGQPKPDRRQSIADRRSKTSPYFYNGHENSGDQTQELEEDRRSGIDRRYHASSAVNIVVVSAGPLKYGLVVDELHDSEEIVVKPLGKHIKKCKGYIGATILGDGRVALILDIPNIAKMTKLTSVDASDRALEVSQAAAKASEDVQSLVIFRNAEDEQFAIPLSLVERIERVKRSEIEQVGNRKTIQYRGKNLPLVGIEEVVEVKPLADQKELEVIVFQIANREVGLLATGPIDVLDVAIEIDTDTLKQQGILGSTIINGQTTLMLDIYGLVEALYPSWFTELKTVEVDEGESITVLLAEDSDFFRAHVKKFLEDEGYRVIEAEDGLIAWEILQERSDEIDLVLTDIEMPNMDGFTLTEKIKTDNRYSHLPVIALTTLADEESIEKGKAAGVDNYQIKLDKESLLEGIYKVMKGLASEKE